MDISYAENVSITCFCIKNDVFAQGRRPGATIESQAATSTRHSIAFEHESIELD